MEEQSVWVVILPKVVDVLVPLVLTAITTVTTFAINELRKKLKGDVANALLDRLDKAASLAVHEVEQTIVVELKAAAADGVITDSERIRIKEACTRAVMRLLGQQGVRDLSAMVDDVDTAVSGAIEAKVRELRLRQGA